MSRVLRKNQASFLTDSAAAYPSVNHSWIFSVLENTWFPDFLCRFLRSIHRDSTTHVEFAGVQRGHFLWPEEYDKVVLRVVFFLQCPSARSSDCSKNQLSQGASTVWISCSLHNALTLTISPFLHPLLESRCLHWHLHSVLWIASLAST